MEKKELEHRYEHKYPGFKTVEQLNDKFRDVEINPKKPRLGQSNLSNTLQKGPYRVWNLDPSTSEAQKEDYTNQAEIQASQQVNQGQTSLKFAGKNLRVTNIDGRVKQERLYSSLPRVNPATDAYFYPNPSFLIHPRKYPRLKR